MTSPNLSKGEIKKLAWPSRIALAVRCAQRVAPFFVEDPSRPGEARTLEAAVRAALRVACDRISLGTPPEADLGNRVTAVRADTDAFNSRLVEQRGLEEAAKEGRIITPAGVRRASARAVEAAFRCAWEYDRAQVDQVRHVSAYAREAVGSLVLIGRARSSDLVKAAERAAAEAAVVAVEAARADLHWLAANVVATNAVPEGFFARPLWPNGSPVDEAFVQIYAAAAAACFAQTTRAEPEPVDDGGLKLLNDLTGHVVDARAMAVKLLSQQPGVMTDLVEAEQVRGEEHAVVVAFPTAPGKGDDFMGAVPQRSVSSVVPLPPGKPTTARHVVLLWPRSQRVPDGHHFATWLDLPSRAAN